MPTGVQLSDNYSHHRFNTYPKTLETFFPVYHSQAYRVEWVLQSRARILLQLSPSKDWTLPPSGDMLLFPPLRVNPVN